MEKDGHSLGSQRDYALVVGCGLAGVVKIDKQAGNSHVAWLSDIVGRGCYETT